MTILEKEAELYLASIRDFLERRVGGRIGDTSQP